MALIERVPEAPPAPPAPPLAVAKSAAPAAAAPRRRTPWSLSFVIPGAATLLLAVSQILAAAIAEVHSREILLREMEARLLTEARQVALAASTAMLDDFPELRLQPAIREFLQGQTDVVAVLVADANGVVRGHGDSRRLGARFAPETSWKPLASEAARREGEQLLGDANVIAVLAPVLHSSGRRLGTAVLVVRRGQIERALAHARMRQGAVLLAVLVIGSLTTLLLMLRALAPLAALRRGLERIGRGDLDARIEPRGLHEFHLLADTLNEMTVRLRQGQREALERERMAGELEVASQIQRSLLPSGRFVTGEFVVVGAQRAATEVGGDYFDILTRPDGRVVLAMADVAGKGVGGSLVMSMVASLLRAFSQGSATPAALLRTLEQQLGGSLQRGTFITMWTALLDPENGHLIHASAGHLPTLLLHGADGRCEWIRGRAVPIGIGPAGARRKVEDQELSLAPGDVLVQLTDGFTEAPHHRSGEQFGFERFEAMVREHAAGGPDAIVPALLEGVAAWTGGPSSDDETVLVLARRAARPSETPMPALPADPAELLAEAKGRGVHVLIPGRLAELDGLRFWLAECPPLSLLAEEAGRRLELVLYELCANIVEHGYGRTEPGSIDLWWVPAAGAAPARDARAALDAVRGGHFLIADHGRPFDPGRGFAPNFDDPATRRMGRGFGLEMARRIASRIRYFPNTQHGNLTVICFDPSAAPPREQEERHA